MKTGVIRDKDIFKLRQKSLTFKQIGVKYNISSERARQLYLREQDRINNHKKIKSSQCSQIHILYKQKGYGKFTGRKNRKS